MTRSLFDKLWQSHLVQSLDSERDLLYVDRIFLHERTGSIALKSLAATGRPVQRPQQAFCTMDHIVDTFPGRGDSTIMPSGSEFITATRDACRDAGIHLFDLGDSKQGIAHVVAAEQGICLPGLSQVCPDSHTCTLGGIGALAWGIGSTDAEHALATKTLAVKKPRSMRVIFDGVTAPGVTAKDMILHLIGKYGADGGAGYAIEFAGSGIAALDIEARMTLCNMGVEFSAFTVFIAVDERTIEYAKSRPLAPKGAALAAAIADWQQLHSEPDAQFDKTLTIDCRDIRPTVTWGTNPRQSLATGERIPYPQSLPEEQQAAAIKALSYMDLQAGTPIGEVTIDAAFIGSCTNARLSDLRAAAAILKGRKVATGVAAVAVPASGQVKLAAEAEGLHTIFEAAGFEWREPGCSMCFYAGGETFGEGKRVISSTNRNFEGRQGPKVKTHIASPETVAASAIAGRIISANDLAELT